VYGAENSVVETVPTPLKESASNRDFCKTEFIPYEKTVLFSGLIKSAKIEQPALCLDNFRRLKARYGRKFYLDHGGSKTRGSRLGEIWEFYTRMAIWRVKTGPGRQDDVFRTEDSFVGECFGTKVGWGIPDRDRDL